MGRSGSAPSRRQGHGGPSAHTPRQRVLHAPAPCCTRKRATLALTRTRTHPLTFNQPLLVTTALIFVLQVLLLLLLLSTKPTEWPPAPAEVQTLRVGL